MHSFAVLVVSYFRNLKGWSMMGRVLLTFLFTTIIERVSDSAPSPPWTLSGVWPWVGTMPAKPVRKSPGQKAGRNSPSVTACRPAASCIRTASRMQPSSIFLSCGDLSARAFFSEAGRKRLPTWSARKGGRMAQPTIVKCPPPCAWSNTGRCAISNEVQGIAITHPGRLIWPQLGITKLELARYIGEVGEWMLPQVANRPLTLLRCPDGAGAKCFYQRHPGGRASKKGEYLFVNSIPALISLAQNGVVEIHTWGVTLPDARHPDRITLDLDPDPRLSWEELRSATLLTETLLAGLQLKSFLKTTGGKGLHVVVPIVPRLGWDEVRNFSRLIAERLAKEWPDVFTANMSKQKRTGKLFVDYLRNAEARSAVAAYSPRARPRATWSTPLDWEELDKTDLRAKFTVRSVPRRLAQLRHDPWRDYFTTRQSITAAMRRALGGARLLSSPP